MSKFIRVTMSDGSQWDIPAQAVAESRARDYAQLDLEIDTDRDATEEDVYANELAETLSDDTLLLDWAGNNVLWSHVRSVAKQVRGPIAPDYASEWSNAEKEVVEY